ncbi:MAG: sugar phosphate isomerase/epimerase [Clostridiales bacterium]|nr:sugar phosphate isomerase/epimerase [Clostridiales bacterium]
MEIICAPSSFMGIERPKKGLLDIKKGGFDKILLDIAMRCSPWELENFGKKIAETDKSIIRRSEKKEIIKISENPEKMAESLEVLFELCRTTNVTIPAARAPYLRRNTERDDLNGLLLKLTMESIKVCGHIVCKYLIVRPLFTGEAHGDEWNANREYYLKLAAVAKEHDVTILLENQCFNINGHFVRGICSDAAEAVEWVDRLNEEVGEERFGFCMDVGVCSLCAQNIQDFILTLKNRIKAVILRDCDGHNEESLLPYTVVGNEKPQTDWLGLIRGLREICFDGALIMDFSSTAAAIPPLLRPQILPFAKTIAEYFKWQIGIKSALKKYDKRVLFGAGNMCRNFMKCYGEEFPPLFTCDNNSARWGEQFEGLKIRPPEALKELEPDCAVFICNIYYKEIEDQLRNMGIGNPIEYFNDEYMPSFYFERLEYWEGAGE